jgi:protein-S-isoprenylcysteine O-methyltransferase Ste14
MIALGLLVWLVGMPLAHGVLPWALSTLAAGIAILAWIFASGLARVREIPERLDRLASPFLMTRGPYAVSRNPMYVAELALWLGWAILFGSVPVAVGLAVLAAMIRLLVPIEERGLAARFGEPYRLRRAVSPLHGRGPALARRAPPLRCARRSSSRGRPRPMTDAKGLLEPRPGPIHISWES